MWWWSIFRNRSRWWLHWLTIDGYANHVVERGWVYSDYGAEAYQDEEVPDFWPWGDCYWKPKSPRQDLVRAAALLIAEIERLDREVKAESMEDL